MAATKKNTAKLNVVKNPGSTPKKTVEVMYQNLNGVWYAFATIGESIFVGKIPQKAPKDGDLSQVKLTPLNQDFDAA